MQDYYRICRFLLQEATVVPFPNMGFGEYGERHVRFALIENERGIQVAAKGIKSLLNSAKKQ